MVHSNFLDTADLLHDENSPFSRDKMPGVNRIPDKVDILLKLNILKVLREMLSLIKVSLEQKIL